MQLMHAATSPFVRKVVIVAHELGLDARIEKVAATASPVKRNDVLGTLNPLCKLPTLVTDDGLTLFDSRVIAEYLCAQAAPDAPVLLPAEGAARWTVRRAEALGDGLLDAALLIRYEGARPEALQWDQWSSTQLLKVTAALDEIECMSNAFNVPVDLGQIAVACALGYLDFRFEALDWRTSRPAATAWFARFALRPSFAATRPA
ncbi:glutathione S-transferase N-terminal domain-containing protein [Caballeronia sp. LZ035]|uniref:glutathione S-transferase N-terminal domain-containing protein n=1 Tax=Caballeronia sp. LZ035 TaxID=3038568 RepID=UPI002860FED3|nr:glutathione S-transferase N-terminal domain-containing protein [Caballeronia sp. LZ035]MDR5759160.1 glutathione S-transferase N-terminal domain-containing protein [Caballeronia sp. LZ035]